MTEPTGKRAPLKFLIDSGASCTLPSNDQRKAIDLAPTRSMMCTLADGASIKRTISECLISLRQGEGHTPVILGEKDDEPLLGIVTLGILGLTLNPFNRTLQQMRAMLA